MSLVTAIVAITTVKNEIVSTQENPVIESVMTAIDDIELRVGVPNF